jgi:5'-methylthioadenosine phosphorylase
MLAVPSVLVEGRRLAVIGGHTILGTAYAFGGERVRVRVDDRDVAVIDCGTHVVLQRHGLDKYTPAHLVRHGDNLVAATQLGCDRVLAVSSVGGLRRDLGVGTFLAPDDFIALRTPTLFDDARGHRIPGFDAAWRARIVDAWQRRAPASALVDGGVYWQTTGPRFETRAEIRFIAQFADVVGMTVASECVVAGELGLPYAAVCVVDNMANGLRDESLTIEEFERGKAATRASVLAALDAVIPELT